MNQHKIWNSRIIAYAFILLFIILKIPHLDVAFFWDESWPYASAIHSMYENGPSLRPDAIPAELSRGHPTLFIFLATSWMKVFGTSLIAIHSFALCIATLCAISIYEIGRKIFFPTVGFFSLVLIIFQHLFFVQSSFLLPEIFLGFVGLLCFYFYAQNRLVALAISLLVLFFIKETAVVLGLALGICSLLRWFYRDISTSKMGQHLLVYSTPILAYVAFFSYQKHLLGWYFFPFHMEIIEYNFSEIFSKLIRGITILQFSYHRWIITVFSLLILIFILIKIPAVRKRWNPKSKWQQLRQKHWSTKQTFVISILIFAPIFLLFCAMNYLINRYFIVLFIPINIVTVAACVYLINQWNRQYLIGFCIIILGFHTIRLYTNEWREDGLQAFNVVRLEQEMTQYMETHFPYNTPISSNAYLLRVQLTDPHTRYLQSDSIFTHVSENVNDSTQLVLFSIKELDKEYYEQFKNNKQFHLLKRFEKGVTWTEVYQRNP